MSTRITGSGARRTACAAGEAFFRGLGRLLGGWCDGIADWFKEAGAR